MQIPSWRGARRWASSTVEFAFVAPIFFLILFGIYEYARYLFTIQMVNNAAREGARYVAVTADTDVTTAGIQTYVDQYLMGQGAAQLVGYTPASSITVYKADPVTGQSTGQSWTTAAWGDPIGVTVTGTYQPLMPGLAQPFVRLVAPGCQAA